MNTHPKTTDAPRIEARNGWLDAGDGFAAQAVTAGLARRQLHMSLGVMGVIVAAALAVVATVGVSPRTAPQLKAELTVQQPEFVRSMTASSTHATDRRPGG